MITSYIDASQVYGSYQGLLDRLRGENGKYLVCDFHDDLNEISGIRCIITCATSADFRSQRPWKCVNFEKKCKKNFKPKEKHNALKLFQDKETALRFLKNHNEILYLRT